MNFSYAPHNMLALVCIMTVAKLQHTTVVEALRSIRTGGRTLFLSSVEHQVELASASRSQFSFSAQEFPSTKTMAAYSTLLPQKHCSLLSSAQRPPRSARTAQKVSAQVQPSSLILPGRSSTACHAAATLESLPATQAKEKPLGEGPTIINGQVMCLLVFAPVLRNSTLSCNHIYQLL